MNIQGKNGVNSMENILADIRRMAAEPKPVTIVRMDRPGRLAAVVPSDDLVSLCDELSAGVEFADLPNILRPAQERREPTVTANISPFRSGAGMRLLDALRGVEPVANDVAFDEPLAADLRDVAAAAPPRASYESETVLDEAMALATALRQDIAKSSPPTVGAGLPFDADTTTTASMTTMPALVASDAAFDSIQDSLAELLRPMLRQWLAENMPSIVEKALHMELADTFASGRRNS